MSDRFLRGGKPFLFVLGLRGGPTGGRWCFPTRAFAAILIFVRAVLLLSFRGRSSFFVIIGIAAIFSLVWVLVLKFTF